MTVKMWALAKLRKDAQNRGQMSRIFGKIRGVRIVPSPKLPPGVVAISCIRQAQTWSPWMESIFSVNPPTMTVRSWALVEFQKNAQNRGQMSRIFGKIHGVRFVPNFRDIPPGVATISRPRQVLHWSPRMGSIYSVNPPTKTVKMWALAKLHKMRKTVDRCPGFSAMFAGYDVARYYTAHVNSHGHPKEFLPSGLCSVGVWC